MLYFAAHRFVSLTSLALLALAACNTVGPRTGYVAPAPTADLAFVFTGDDSGAPEGDE